MLIMCGIFTLLNVLDYCYNNSIIQKQFNKGERRGPEFSKIINIDSTVIGFHRLAINGLNESSNQPFFDDNVILICNGEIYNYRDLNMFKDTLPRTDSDCESIIHMYIKYGIEQTLIMLDGVFSFILYDFREDVPTSNHIFIARDPLGIRPLYKFYDSTTKLYGYASELKCLEYFYNIDPMTCTIEQFKPGSYTVFKKESTIWIPIVENKPYFLLNFPYTSIIPLKLPQFEERVIKDKYFHMISEYLNLAVIKRCTTTERPVACLLSGGLDSSLIASLVTNYFKKYGIIIETYSIGLENSEDIKNARIVAEYIGSKHTEIILTEEDFFNAIPEVIEAIESYDTTTVRASIGNYILGKYISQHSLAKVIFNGDGSDELFGGYKYMNKCPDDIEFDKETRRLLTDIHLFDVLRSDKSISSNGLEPRTPFLDKTFVNTVLSIPPSIRNHNNYNNIEKLLLRLSFSEKYFTNNEGLAILPKSILWRKKEAFSDGVSKVDRSLFTILQEYIFKSSNSTEYLGPCIDIEKNYYKEIFDQKFPNCQHILPYFWMPRYILSTDPSARTLNICDENICDENICDEKV